MRRADVCGNGWHSAGLQAVLPLQHSCAPAPARRARPSRQCVQVRYGDRFVEELHLPVEVLSFESDQPGSSGAAPRDLPSAAPETPASEGDGRLAHASPLPWTTPPREVGAWLFTVSSRHMHAAPSEGPLGCGSCWAHLAVVVVLQACLLAVHDLSMLSKALACQLPRLELSSITASTIPRSHASRQGHSSDLPGVGGDELGQRPAMSSAVSTASDAL